MKQLIFCLIFFSGIAFGQPADQTAWKNWVPQGWKLLQHVTGDLNKDGQDDAVLIIEQNNPSNRKNNENLGASELNLNPRHLLILFQTAQGYQKKTEIKTFLPSEHSEENPCLEDPLLEGGVFITRGILKIDLHYFLSCGSWGVSHHTFSFRYENDRFRLIGFDTSYFMRNSGEASETSTNYLTGKQKITKGLNMFETGKPQVIWKTLPKSGFFYLDTMTSDCYSEGGKRADWCFE